MKVKIAKAKPESVADCEAALRALEEKRAELVQRGEKLPEERRNASYDAHVENSLQARRTLNRVAAEIATYATELASLDDAITAAKNKVLIAQAFEADQAKRAKAKESVAVIAAFKKAGHDLDAALRQIAKQGEALNGLLSQLHATTGSNFPSHDQLDTLGYAAVMTALLRTPWARQFRPMQPSQRREFGPLFAGWAEVLENRIKPLLADVEDEAA